MIWIIKNIFISIRDLRKKDDLLILISSSGNSKNIMNP